MTREQSASERGAFEAGYTECAEEGLLEAVQRLLAVSPLGDVLTVVAESCEVLSAVPETIERDAKKWMSAADAIHDLCEDEAIKDAP